MFSVKVISIIEHIIVGFKKIHAIQIVHHEAFQFISFFVFESGVFVEQLSIYYSRKSVDILKYQFP